MKAHSGIRDYCARLISLPVSRHLTLALIPVAFLGVWFGRKVPLVRAAIGEKILAVAPERNLGQIAPRSRHIVSFPVKSFLRGPVTLVGMQSNCGCTTLATSLPATIPGGATFPIDVLVVAPPKAGRFSSSLLLYTDSPDHPWTRVTVKGLVR